MERQCLRLMLSILQAGGVIFILSGCEQKESSDLKSASRSEDTARSSVREYWKAERLPAQVPPMKPAPKGGQNGIHKYGGESTPQESPPANIQTETDSIIAREIEMLSVSRILFNPPAEMKVGVEDRIEVRIAKGNLPGFAEGLRGPGIAQIESVKIGTFMQVHLYGKSFEIKSLTHEEQLITESGFTQWDWDVTPLKSGIQKLEITVTVRILVTHHREERKDYPVFERLVSVKVNLVYSIRKFFSDNWQWIVSTVLGSGLVGWLAKKRISKRKK